MPPSQRIGGLIVVHVALALVSLPVAALFEWGGWFLSTVQAAQLSLLSIWGVLGTSSFDRRFAAFTVGAGAWLWLVCLRRSLVASRMLSTTMLVMLATIAVLCVVRWQWLKPRSFSADQIPSAKPFQYSIRWIMIATTLTAVLIVAMQLVYNLGGWRVVLFLWAPALSSAFAVLYAWAALRPHQPAVPVAFALIATSFTSLAILTQQVDVTRILISLGLSLCRAGIVLGSLLVIRSCGVRLLTSAEHAETCPQHNEEATAMAADYDSSLETRHAKT